MAEAVLQHPILSNFLYPFLLVFFIVFAVLEKTNLVGKEKRQLNALISFVIGLIFVTAVFPKEVVSNMVLFLSVALVIVFIVLLLWGFIFSKEDGGVELTKGMKYALFGVVSLGIIIAILWATGYGGKVYSGLFEQSWSENFWTSAVFVVVIGIALGVIIKGPGKK